MSASHPQADNLTTGFLEFQHGHRVYWEDCGNPKGVPILLLHGGPGSGVSASLKSLFNPSLYRIISMDQRGCGRSLPNAADSGAALTANTTWHLVGDIEALRERLGLRSWLIYGGSWGATLGLAYAQAHPARVKAMILAGVTMTRSVELDWLYGDAGRLLPSAFAAFQSGAPEAATAADRIEAYARQLAAEDPGISSQAAENWCAWEVALACADPRSMPSARWQDPRFRLCFARLVTHYFQHRAWLSPNQLLDQIGILADIPASLIHSRLDLAAPLETAWLLHQRWPKSRLVVLDGGIHSGSGYGMADAVANEAECFAAMFGSS
jgi:proline iminopeptidase